MRQGRQSKHPHDQTRSPPPRSVITTYLSYFTDGRREAQKAAVPSSGHTAGKWRQRDSNSTPSCLILHVCTSQLRPGPVCLSFLICKTGRGTCSLAPTRFGAVIGAPVFVSMHLDICRSALEFVHPDLFFPLPAMPMHSCPSW